MNTQITLLDPKKYKTDDDINELLENERFEEELKFIEAHAKSSSLSSFRKRVEAKIGKIDELMPSFNLVFSWVSLNAKLEETKIEMAFKWQPKTNAESWKDIEKQVITYELEHTGSENLDKFIKLPFIPWKFSNDFFSEFGIDDSEKALISRVEIRALENRIVFVVKDNIKYAKHHYMFWEFDGHIDVENQDQRIDLAAKTAKFTKMADLPDLPKEQKAIYMALRSQIKNSPNFYLYGDHCNHSYYNIDRDIIDEIIVLNLMAAEDTIKNDEDTTF